MCVSIVIPENVRAKCDQCFHDCKSLKHANNICTCAASKLERTGESACSATSVRSVSIPSSIVELGDKGFHDCWYIHVLTLSNHPIFGVLVQMLFPRQMSIAHWHAKTYVVNLVVLSFEILLFTKSFSVAMVVFVK